VIGTRTSILLLAALFAAACGDDAAPAVPTALVRVATEPAGAHCPHGGSAVHAGLDDDANGALDDAEIDGTQYVCSSADAASLVRTEPADERCAHGGTAVLSGLDRDGNGTLDAAEVATTTLVCADALVLPATRLDAEAAGANCAAGGTAVRTGLDLDGDGELGDGEVNATRYVCNDLELTRVDAEPAGARCVAGGAAVHAGRDRDGDGALGDTEIERTEVVCGTVVVGDVEVETAAQLAALRGIVAITGDLDIETDGVAAIELPALRTIGGRLEIRHATGIERIELPVLTTVTGTLDVRSQPLTALALPLLADAGDVAITDNAQLARLELPALVTAASLDVRDNPIATLDLGALQRTDRMSLWHIRASAVVLPALFSTGDVYFVDSQSTSFSAPRLTFVWGGVRIGRSTTLRTIELPAVELITADLLFRDMPLLASFALPRLATLGGDFDLWSNAALTDFSVPLVQTIGGWFMVTDNPALRSLAGLRNLYSVQSQFIFYGNRALRDLSELASLRRIGGPTEIVDTHLVRLGLPRLAAVDSLEVGVLGNPINTMLQSLDLPALRLASSLHVVEAPELTELGLPALLAVQYGLSVWYAPKIRRCALEAFAAELAAPPDSVHFVEVGETPCE
jgi:hypothetical protein